MGNPVVQKVIVGLLSLQGMLLQEVYGKKGERLRTPPVLGSKGLRGLGHPVVLFFKGKPVNPRDPRDPKRHEPWTPKSPNPQNLKSLTPNP
jgi:hypothetical protein